jgi:hypothetical protein
MHPTPPIKRRVQSQRNALDPRMSALEYPHHILVSGVDDTGSVYSPMTNPVSKYLSLRGWNHTKFDFVLLLPVIPDKCLEI